MTYLLFCGAVNYPAGGADDFAGAFQSLAQAKQFFDDNPAEWAHIATWEDGQMRIVCSYGPGSAPGREGVAAWHDCRDV